MRQEDQMMWFAIAAMWAFVLGLFAIDAVLFWIAHYWIPHHP